MLIWRRNESDITNVARWWPFRHLPSHKCERQIKCIQITNNNFRNFFYHLPEKNIYEGYFNDNI